MIEAEKGGYSLYGPLIFIILYLLSKSNKSDKSRFTE